MPESIPEIDPNIENNNSVAKKNLPKQSPELSQDNSRASQVESSFEEKTQNKKAKIKVGIVDISSGIEEKAIDTAERELEKRGSEQKGIKGFFGKVWRNYFYDYERLKAKNKAKKKIESTKNLFANEEESFELSDKSAKLATAKRFIEEAEGLIHAEVGEAREILNTETVEGRKIETEIKGLIDQFVEGKISEEDFDSRKNVILSSTREAMSREVLDKGVIYADNLLEAANQIKALMEHSDGLEKLDYDLEIVLGKGKTGVRTEANYNKIDKFTNFVMESKVGRYVNETTLASAVAITSGILSFATKSKISQTLRSKITFGAGALITGVGAGLRESRKVKLERKSHARQMAEGREFDEENEKLAERREKMEETRYETIGAKNLIDSLSKGLKENATEKDLESYFADKMSFLSDAETRVQLSDKEKIDLVHYTDVTLVEEERFALDLAKAKAKVELRKLVEEGKIVLPNNQSFDTYLESNIGTKTKLIREGDRQKGIEGMKDKDKLFRKLKQKRVAGAVAKGLATGLLVGTITQEIGAAFQDNKVGFFERIFDKAFNKPESKEIDHATFLESVRGWIQNGKFGGGNVSFSGTEILPTVEYQVDENTFCLPEGYDIVEVDQKIDGYALMKDGEVILNYFTVNEDGTLTDEAKDAFVKNGIKFDEMSTSIEADDVVREITDDEFIKNHLEDTDHIKRDLWYGNDTPSPVFDKNELKLDWGGVDGKGIDANGNYVFDMSRMTESGSFQGLESADAKALLAEGKLKILLSASDGTQSYPFEVAINPDGTATIDPDSPAGKLFDMHDGKAEFLGRYAEVAEVRGEVDGIEHVRILATHVGDGMDKISDTVGGGSEDFSETIIYDIPEKDITFVDPTLPPVIPLDARKGLGKTRRKTQEEIENIVGKPKAPVKKEEKKEEVEEEFESAWRSGLDQWKASSPEAWSRAKNAESSLAGMRTLEEIEGFPLLTKEVMKTLEGKSEEELKDLYVANVVALKKAEKDNNLYGAVGSIYAMDSIIDYLDYKKSLGEDIISKENFIKSKRDGGIGAEVSRPSVYSKEYLKGVDEKLNSLIEEKEALEKAKKSKKEIEKLEEKIKEAKAFKKEASFLLGLNKKGIIKEMRKRKGGIDTDNWSDEGRDLDDEGNAIEETPPRVVNRDTIDKKTPVEEVKSALADRKPSSMGQTATSLNNNPTNSSWRAASKGSDDQKSS